MAVSAATAGSTSLWADEPSPATAGSVDQRIEQLDQEIRILKRQREIDLEEADKKAKDAAIVTAGKDGCSVKSADGKFHLKLRGYVQADARFFLDDGLNASDTFVLRRVRPIIEGTVFKNFDFRIMPDFGGATTGDRQTGQVVVTRAQPAFLGTDYRQVWKESLTWKRKATCSCPLLR